MARITSQQIDAVLTAVGHTGADMVQLIVVPDPGSMVSVTTQPGTAWQMGRDILTALGMGDRTDVNRIEIDAAEVRIWAVDLNSMRGDGDDWNQDLTLEVHTIERPAAHLEAEGMPEAAIARATSEGHGNG